MLNVDTLLLTLTLPPQGEGYKKCDLGYPSLSAPSLCNNASLKLSISCPGGATDRLYALGEWAISLLGVTSRIDPPAETVHFLSKPSDRGILGDILVSTNNLPGLMDADTPMTLYTASPTYGSFKIFFSEIELKRPEGIAGPSRASRRYSIDALPNAYILGPHQRLTTRQGIPKIFLGSSAKYDTEGTDPNPIPKMLLGSPTDTMRCKDSPPSSQALDSLHDGDPCLVSPKSDAPPAQYRSSAFSPAESIDMLSDAQLSRPLRYTTSGSCTTRPHDDGSYHDSSPTRCGARRLRPPLNVSLTDPVPPLILWRAFGADGTGAERRRRP
ncbi:hypothetical protein C8R44DRAFT_890293 [Mycena epipterygia]|nr:hypothetical protein C8R44DRAFT_890293 [Mycena epipterygia]